MVEGRIEFEGLQPRLEVDLGEVRTASSWIKFQRRPAISFVPLCASKTTAAQIESDAMR